MFPMSKFHLLREVLNKIVKENLIALISGSKSWMLLGMLSGEFTTPVLLGIIRFCQRRGARVADWGGLENRCGLYGPPWVRIPPPPPHQNPAISRVLHFNL